VESRGRREWIGQVDILPKFEARWLEEEDFTTQVEGAWAKAMEDGVSNVMDVQKKVLGNLWEWVRNVLGELDERISKFKKELEFWRRQNISQDAINREHFLRDKLERLQDQQNTY